jgi:hypothetical protein
MIRVGIIFIFVLLMGCSEDRKLEDFIHEEGGKEEQDFREDSKKCTKEKDKFSHKIQGREFGFEGEHTGYLGCMKLKGWSQKTIDTRG